jgi:hypothetical protein
MSKKETKGDVSEEKDITGNDELRAQINVGARMDIPTGFFVAGQYDEQILVGGLGHLEGLTGIPNSFKTAIVLYKQLSALDKVLSTIDLNLVKAHTYDCEYNLFMQRIFNLSRIFPNICATAYFENGRYKLTDREILSGNKWAAELRESLESKVKNRKKYTVTTPFMTPDRKGMQTTLVPSFGFLDSLTAFETDDMTDKKAENELGSKDNNTIHMRSGLVKTQLIADLPFIGVHANHYTQVTAHIGKTIDMPVSGGMAPPPSKATQFMKQGEKLKGVGAQFLYLTNNFLGTTKVIIPVASDKSPMYPADDIEKKMIGDKDLNIVTIGLIRSKTGASGREIELAVSMEDGVQPVLTEFWGLKSNDRFGLGGNNETFHLEIYPDVSMNRINLRRLIASDTKLCRAMNITSELQQMFQCYRHVRGRIPSMKVLYETIKDKGYDWDMILTKTRGWWAFDDIKHPQRFLSSMDILRMFEGVYHPYWLEDDKKTIKPEFAVNMK